jgi:hypothetical protein
MLRNRYYEPSSHLLLRLGVRIADPRDSQDACALSQPMLAGWPATVSALGRGQPLLIQFADPTRYAVACLAVSGRCKSLHLSDQPPLRAGRSHGSPVS